LLIPLQKVNREAFYNYMSDNDTTIKPQAGVDIAEAIDNIVALRKYLTVTADHRLLENFSDLGEGCSNA